MNEENRMKLKWLFLVMAACLVTPAFAADDMDTYTRRLAAAKDTAEEGEIYKMMGDYHARRSAYEKAAEAYLKALPHVRDGLTDDEMTQVAVYLSWGGKLKAAEMELRALLQKNPANTRARLQMARVLLWSGDVDGALAEAETVLTKHPDDRSVLLVKAEVLRHKGETDRAIAIYKGLLERSDDFDTRIGLSYAYLEKGDIKQAGDLSSLLRPEYPYQIQELEKLNAEIMKPRPEVGKPDLLKAEGDRLAAKQAYKAAAEKYEESLGLPHHFSVDQRLRMATVMSWGEKHEPARREIETLLAKEPSHIPARLQLARVLLWTSELDAAIREAETILTAQPGHRDALLVKANALRRKGFYRDADGLYTSLLAQADDFDAREGQTYSYLTRGDRLKTDESMSLLKPNYSYEIEEFARIGIDRDWAFRPRLYGGVTYYDDKDDNQVTTYSAGTQFWLGNWRTNLDYRHVSARAPDRSNESDDIQLSTYSRMPWYGGLGGGIGLSQGSFMTWKALADVDVLYGSVGFLAAKEAYAYTAELVEKDIRALILSARIVQRPTDRITLSGSYAYRDYSDDNYSHDVQASVAYTFFRKPATSAGYRFRYLDFQRQSRGGYFDPDNFFANSIFVNLSFETNRWYGYMEPYIGYQTFDRYSESRSETFYGAAGSLGYRVTDRIAVEGSAEWGNYAASGFASGGESGWYYYQIGLRVVVLF
jgi:tetratricopeptide (TPR) repeat protein